MRATLAPWRPALLCLLGLALVLAVARASMLPPDALPASADAQLFSEARARSVVSVLSREVGVREAGTEGARSAERALLARLQTLPRVELSVQDASGAVADGSPALVVAYRARNVLARLPGRDRHTVLLSAHYDSPPTSPGAADNASGVAVAVETLRALSAGPALEHSVLVVLTEGEETGLVGARAFVRHPLAREVDVAVNLDAGGTAGRSILLRSSPGAAWLLGRYAHAAPHPHGTVLVQQLLEGNVLHGVETDLRAYLDAGIPGLDFTTYEEGYPYHTAYDRLETLGVGMLQHEGDNTLALVRALAQGPLPPPAARERLLFYDLLGRAMVTYSPGAGLALAALALTLALFAVARAARIHALTLRELALATLFAALALLAALFAAALFSLLAPYLFGRPHGWFSRPSLALLAYGGAALAALSLVHALWSRGARRRGLGADARVIAAYSALTLLWSLALALLALAGQGAAYLALWWTAGLALALLLAARLRGALARCALAAGALPAALLTTATALSLLLGMVARTGHIPTPFSLDPALALLVALMALPPGALAAALAHGTEGAPARVSLLGALSAVAGLLGLLVNPIYTPVRARRVVLEHLDPGDGGARIVLRLLDYPPPGPALPAGARALGNDTSHAVAWGRGLRSYAVAAPPSHRPAAVLEVLSREVDPVANTRSVRVRLWSTGESHTRLRLPRAALLGWSLETPLPLLRPEDGEYLLDVLGLPADGREFTFTLRGTAPVTVPLGRFYSGPSGPLRAVLGRMPAWVHPLVLVSRTSSVEL